MKVYSEITPLREDDIFVILDHPNAKFDYPVHLHPEFELNLVTNCSGSRIVGDSVMDFSETDLVLIGPNTYHCWERTDDGKANSHVITIQFEDAFVENSFLSKKSMVHIKKLLQKSARGIEFYGEARNKTVKLMESLSGLHGFNSTITFLQILNELASSQDYNTLASDGFNLKLEHNTSKKINMVYDYVLKNYNDVDLRLSKVAEIVNMSDSAFSHFFKKRTNKSFTQFIIDLKIGQASKLLLETHDSISEICYTCGFNNISNFNRTFKKNKGITPSGYRSKFTQNNKLEEYTLAKE
ncbi:AraC family transcriptional regulator [Maribacter sp. TH_r10]|uniref:AraC family transcriptional regulator n=1 Tax=Maribacter sp. TH_r10 TaxID=3082086 RepID=UPI002955456B|nr:AraC family transcriptional regulator [Maribacter sp. TH_r10]MDV7139208.1 AraC family transcriptional regulator [Maribacter sp. TH_r10]